MSRPPIDIVPVTLTHARVRALQGDHAGARAVLRALLDLRPDHAGALRLLREVAGARAVPSTAEEEEPVASRAPASADALAGRFAAELNPEGARRRAARRLRTLLDRVERARDAGGP